VQGRTPPSLEIIILITSYREFQAHGYDRVIFIGGHSAELIKNHHPKDLVPPFLAVLYIHYRLWRRHPWLHLTHLLRFHES
jgi:hypothetical protein